MHSSIFKIALHNGIMATFIIRTRGRKHVYHLTQHMEIKIHFHNFFNRYDKICNAKELLILLN